MPDYSIENKSSWWAEELYYQYYAKMVFLSERNDAIKGLQVKLESDPFWDCQNITWN